MATARQVHDESSGGEHVVGWKLGDGMRQALARHPPRYPNLVADHVTLRSGVDAGCALPDERVAQIVARVDDGSGVEAMVVSIGGGTRRPDGGTYHATWSLAPGREAVESNGVLASGEWQILPEPLEVALVPAILGGPGA